jgi:hypothetical protein
MTARKFRAHPDVVFQKLGDESVLLNLRTGVYWGLNPTGALIWDEIVRHGDLARAVATLQENFEGSPAEMRATVQSLIGDLSREGLVVEDA